MIRSARSFLRFFFAGSLALFCAAAFSAMAQNAPSSKAAAKKTEAKADDAASGKPVQVASYGDWGAFLATQGGKKKTCYALAQPKDRAPAGLKRDPAYVFISSRPAENVHNEISIIMGFPMKDNGEAQAEIGTTRFELIAKGSNAWIKNPAEEGQFIETMKKGSKLVIKAASIKGNLTTDSYSLAGLSQALDRVQKECP
jgi:invasion protein IalB